MKLLESSLLVTGLLLPTISWLTLLLSLLGQLFGGKYSSPILIPVVGPVLLTCWVVLFQHSYWFIPIAWIADIGTLLLVLVSPRLFTEWWRISSFTTTLTLRGSREAEDAVLTFHSTGYYFLERTWRRMPGVTGIIRSGETGTYKQADNHSELIAHTGLRRTIRKTPDGEYLVQEDRAVTGEPHEHSMDGWILRAQQARE